MLHASVFSKANEKLTNVVQLSTIFNALERGYNVIIDDTNLSPKHVRKMRGEIANMFPGVGWKTIRFDCPLSEAMRRNALRQGHARVPEHVIKRMWIQYTNLTAEV
jgi:predicted kinase